jgi:hypothetical protein
MSRCLAALVLLTGTSLGAVVLLAAGRTAVAAPGPKGKDEDLYHPTKVGDKRVSEVRTGDTVTELTEVVTQVKKRDGALLVSVRPEWTGPMTFSPATWSVSDQGVCWVASDGHELSTPAPLLKVRAAPGEAWTWDPGDSGGGRFPKLKFTSGKEEEVEVPAGKFKGLRVDSEFGAGASVVKQTTWYARGVGSVKMSATGLGDGDLVQVLKSFTPGK